MPKGLRLRETDRYTPPPPQKQTHLIAECRSAELWEFNPAVSTWTEVLVDGVAPAARDGHTASVAGSKMVIFGGRGNGSESDPQVGDGTETSLLGDEWEIDLDPTQQITVTTDSPTVSGSSVGVSIVIRGSTTRYRKKNRLNTGLAGL